MPDAILNDRTKRVLTSHTAARHPPTGKRVLRRGDDWVVYLSAAVSNLVRDAVSRQASAAAPSLVWSLVELEVNSGSTTSAQATINYLTAIETPAEPALLLTTEEADELARTGSLVETMPPAARRASVRTQIKRLRILDEALGVAQVAELLCVSQSRVRQRAAARTLYAVKAGNSLRFPTFQFPGGGELSGWDQVAQHFPDDAHPVAVERFMSTPHPDLEISGGAVSPADWLLSGGPALRVAEIIDDAYLIA